MVATVGKLLARMLRALGITSATLISGCGGAPTSTTSSDRPRVADPTTCALDAFAPTSVEPHYEEDTAVKVTVRRLHGADVYIEARAGLTAEWLRHELVPRVDNAHRCALGVPGAEVLVASAGPGFRVTIRARDEEAAEQILRLARAVDTHP